MAYAARGINKCMGYDGVDGKQGIRAEDSAGSAPVRIRGTARADRKTKNLISRLRPGEIAVIAHADIDEVSGRALVEACPKMVINADRSITGRYRCLGPGILLDAGIPVLDGVGPHLLDVVADGDALEIEGNEVFKEGKPIGVGVWVTRDSLEAAYIEAEENLDAELEKFVVNTLQYAIKEKDIILGDIDIPPLETQIHGRHCLIAVRGPRYREDLDAVASYIREMAPVLIGVDGGADALVERGFAPDIIIGDMDSVSDETLFLGAELVAHSYPDGRSPGAERLANLGLSHKTFVCPGTSEDIAMLLAYEKGASLIVAVGTHSNMLDFLEKGRPGMGSTFLVRLKVGSVLVDAKGVSQLYRGRLRIGHIIGILLAAVVPLAAIALFSGSVADTARLIYLKIRVMLGLL